MRGDRPAVIRSCVAPSAVNHRAMLISTVGHSTRSAEELLELLRGAEVRLVVDALVLGGWRVEHLGIGDGRAEHELTEFAVAGPDGIPEYPPAQATLLDDADDDGRAHIASSGPDDALARPG